MIEYSRETLFQMTTLRSIVILRSLLSTTKYYRMACSSSRMMISRATVPLRIEQTCWFSSSNIVHARRRDRTDATVTEDLDNEEEEKDDNDDDNNVDSEQVRWSIFFRMKRHNHY